MKDLGTDRGDVAAGKHDATRQHWEETEVSDGQDNGGACLEQGAVGDRPALALIESRVLEGLQLENFIFSPWFKVSFWRRQAPKRGIFSFPYLVEFGGSGDDKRGLISQSVSLMFK